VQFIALRVLLIPNTSLLVLSLVNSTPASLFVLLRR